MSPFEALTVAAVLDNVEAGRPPHDGLADNSADYTVKRALEHLKREGRIRHRRVQGRGKWEVTP